METIRINFYQAHQDVEAFDTIEAAKASVPQAHNPGRYNGYAVLFELGGKYAVYVHNEDRYYSSYLPPRANVLFGGQWERDQPITEWKPIGRVSDEESDLLKAWFENLAK